MKLNFRQPKRRGELVEMKFMVRATEENIVVSKPYGDSERFDFIVGSRTPLYRIQVRSTSCMSNSNAYTCPLTWGKERTAYSTRDFDFLVLFVVPLDTWYVVPIEAFNRNQKLMAVYPHVAFSGGRFEPFCEAWHLLRRPKPKTKPRKARHSYKHARRAAKSREAAA